MLHTLVGDRERYSNVSLPLLLSNGTGSAQRVADNKYWAVMMAKDAPVNGAESAGNKKYKNILPKHTDKITRSVNIFYVRDEFILGLSFLDKDGEVIWELVRTTVSEYTRTDASYDVTTVGLEDNEIIIGVVAKLH